MSCNCDEELELPVGDQGEPGLPGFLSLPATGSGAAFTDSTNAWVEVPGSRFYFSTNIAKPFSSININIWVGGLTGQYRVRDLISGNVLYTNSNITSTSTTNVESVVGQEIYNSTNALIVVEAKSALANSINVGTITFAYLK